MVWRAGSNALTFLVKNTRRALWSLNLASVTEQRLTIDSVRYGDWYLSPDGRLASVVIEHGGGARDLAVVPVAGGAMRTLVSGDASISGPLFSPDGMQIAYASDRGGSEDVWVVDVAGGAPRQLVTWPGYDNQPVWSDDGSSILFVSNHEARLSDVWKVAAAGGAPTRVTRDGGINSLSARAGFDGTYVTRIGHGGQFGLARLRTDGTLQTVWDRSNAFFAGYLPHDSVVAYVQQADGSQRPMILSAGGGGGRVILKPGEQPWTPSYDGKWLLYAIPANGTFDMGLFNIADGSVRRLTTTPDTEEGEEFRRDGKTVVFARAKTVQRIHSVDLSKLMTSPGPSR